MNILHMLCKSTLIIGLTACSSSASTEENTSTNIKGEKMMLTEIYGSKIKPDHVLKIQENYEEVSNIVFKYFQIGESKDEVISKLNKMGLVIKQEINGNIIGTSSEKSSISTLGLFPKVLEIHFEFNNQVELTNIKSVYFIQE